jgi:hypothetical protein
VEKAVTFKNTNDQILFGILHIPDSRELKSRIGINILNPGLKNRVAPNRINVKMARMFCDMGFYVLRFDPFGIGDSEGELAAHESVMDLWGMIQRGLFVSDTRIANDWFIQEAQLDKLLLIGQCGAAVTSMLVGGEDDRVESVVLIDCSVRLLSSQVDLSDILAETHRPSEMFFQYMRKIISVRSWINFFQLKSDFRGLRKLLARTTNGFLDRDKLNAGNYPNISERFNKQLWDAFCNFMNRKKKVCFLFAENDFALKEFRQDMQMGLLQRHEEFQLQYDVHVIKDANHVYTEEIWQRDLLQSINAWLNQYREAC